MDAVVFGKQDLGSIVDVRNSQQLSKIMDPYGAYANKSRTV